MRRGARHDAAPEGADRDRARGVCGGARGGGLEVLARLYGEALKEKHGLTVIIETRGGASGTIGGELVHKATPDGYTLLFSASTHTTARLVMREVPYDPLTDFVPIARVGE